mgnify:CR=1 FL=1
MKLISSLYKTVAIFGANGQTGREAVYYSLMGGYKTVGFSRNLDGFGTPNRVGNINYNNSRLYNYIGDATHEDSVKEFLSIYKPDSVIIALGGTQVDVATQNIVNNVKPKTKISVVSSMGVDDSKHYPPLFFKFLKFAFLGKMFKSKEKQEKIIKESNLPYSIIRPGGLTNELPINIINIDDYNYKNNSRTYKTPRSNVAIACLDSFKNNQNSIINIEQTFKT